MENIDNVLLRAKSEAKEKLVEAKAACLGKMPQEPEFPYTEQFVELPSDVTELEQRCYELQTKRDCMDEGDDQVISP